MLPGLLLLTSFVLPDETLVPQYVYVFLSPCFALDELSELFLTKPQLLADVVRQTSFQLSSPMGDLRPEHESLSTVEEGECVSALASMHAELVQGTEHLYDLHAHCVGWMVWVR